MTENFCGKLLLGIPILSYINCWQNMHYGLLQFWWVNQVLLEDLRVRQ